jgi:hypothetical protein
MPQNRTESQWQAEFIVSEANGKLSRDAVIVTVAAAGKLVSGQILGRITATGKWVILDTAAADGSQTGAGFLITELLDNTLGGAPVDFKATALTRLAEVNTAEVLWTKAPAGAPLTAPEKTAAITQLLASFIVPRATD